MSARAESDLVERHEEFSCGRDRRLVVARFATRWFVLEGFTTAPLSTYAVHGPCVDRSGLSSHAYAVRDAMAMHKQAAEQGRTGLRVVS